MDTRKEEPIFTAISNNNITEVKRLLKADASLTALTKYDGSEMTPIQFAAKLKHWRIVHEIATQREAINEYSANGTRYGDALYSVIKANKYETAKALLKAHASTEWGNINNNESHIFHAIREKKQNFIELLLNYNADIARKNKYKQTPIMVAANLAENDASYFDIIKFVAEKVTDNKNDRGNFGYALLTVAKSKNIKNKLAVVSSLLQAGANINYQSTNGNTCLHYAVKLNNEKLIAVLLENGADPSTKNDKGTTATDIACAHDFGNAALSLIKHHNNNIDLKYALQFAISNQNQIVAQKLLEAGANCDVYDCKKGNVFIYAAIEKDNVDILALLTRRIDFSKIEKTQDGKTPIMLAKEMHAIKCLGLLAEIYPQEIHLQPPVTAFTSPTEALKAFLLQLNETIQNTNWLVKKPSLVFWLDNEWIPGHPSHLRMISYHTHNVRYADSNEITSAFFKVMKIFLNLNPSTNRHSDTTKFDEETKSEMLALFNQLYQPELTATLNAQQQIHNQAAMTYTYIAPTYPSYLPEQPGTIITHEFAATYPFYAGIYPSLQQEQPPSYDAPHLTISTGQNTSYFIPPQPEVTQALTDSMFPTVPTRGLNRPGVSMFAHAPAASSPNTRQLNANETKHGVSLP